MTILYSGTFLKGVGGMQIIWHIMLTVCLGTTCAEQDVQWFDTEEECRQSLELYIQIPPDGDWDKVVYECKPVNSTGV